MSGLLKPKRVLKKYSASSTPLVRRASWARGASRVDRQLRVQVLPAQASMMAAIPAHCRMLKVSPRISQPAMALTAGEALSRIPNTLADK